MTIEVGNYVQLFTGGGLGDKEVGKVIQVNEGYTYLVRFWVNNEEVERSFYSNCLKKLTTAPLNYVTHKRKVLTQQNKFLDELVDHEYAKTKRVFPMDLKLGDKIHVIVGNDGVVKKYEVVGMLARKDTVEVHVIGAASLFLKKISFVTVEDHG